MIYVRILKGDPWMIDMHPSTNPEVHKDLKTALDKDTTFGMYLYDALAENNFIPVSDTFFYKP